MISALEQALAGLPASATAREQVSRLADLVDGDLPLQGFLEQLLPQLCELFAAPAAVAWMKVQGAVFGVRYRMGLLLPTAILQKRHERRVQFAWHQKRAMIAAPASSGSPHRAGSQNEQDGFQVEVQNRPIITAAALSCIFRTPLPSLKLYCRQPV